MTKPSFNTGSAARPLIHTENTVMGRDKMHQPGQTAWAGPACRCATSPWSPSWPRERFSLPPSPAARWLQPLCPFGSSQPERCPRAAPGERPALFPAKRFLNFLFPLIWQRIWWCSVRQEVIFNCLNSSRLIWRLVLCFVRLLCSLLNY